MVRLREIPRTATFAWSPGTGAPYIATGTKAGAVDADFSSDTQLELWGLELENPDHSVELEPIVGAATDSRFHDIAWVHPNGKGENGVIAGALEDGSLSIWDADKLLAKDSNPQVSKTTKHSGAIKALQFNDFRHELLATAGAKGELFISDLNNISNPFRLGNTAARADDFDCLDWNKKVPHILVTGSNGGFVTVWDVKSKKESLTLNNLGRKAVSSVAWDPEKPTRVITAVPLDTDPLILIWDLRNSNTPEKVLRGHEGGVLSLSWCQQDDDLLLSCGKDNRTICWNPQSGEAWGEFPVVTNWTFQTAWNSRNPNLLATASFDGKVGIHTLQNTKPAHTQNAQSQPVDGEDFFDKAQSQPQISSFSLQKAPRWLERPCGASFGFGGRVIQFSTTDSERGTHRASTLKLSNFAVDDDIGAMTVAFSNAMREGNLKEICNARIEQARLESGKQEWKVIETLIADNPRKELIKYLGISEGGKEMAKDISEDSAADKTDATQRSGIANNKRLSAFFGEHEQDGESFLTELASTKGAKTNNPFRIYSKSEPEIEKQITQALLLGNFEAAMDVCLAEDRLPDAFMIAICGGQACMQKAQKAYFKKQASGPRYLRLLASVVGKNLWDVVYNAELDHWREIMATLCTYASAAEFPDLCEALGDRLEDLSRIDPSDHAHKQNASFCYIAGSKLEKVVGVWIAELKYNEEQGLQDDANDSRFSIHARSLQNFIEKVTVFREVTRYQDKDHAASKDWVLTDLYEKYIEYADIVASHGQLNTAEQYLNLLPNKYPVAEVARNRVKQATRKATPAQPIRQSTTASNAFVPTRPAFQDHVVPAPTQPISSFAQPISAQTSGSYAPANNMFPSANYQPSQPSQAPSGRPIVAPPPSFGASTQGPPRTSSVSPAVPPSKASAISNWNDTPSEFFKPPTSRRATPVAPPIGSYPSYQGQMPSAAPTVAGQPMVIPKATPAPPPPPPKGPAPPPRTQTPQMNPVYQQQQPIERPPSAAATSYAPPPPVSQNQPPMQAERAPLSYNLPPPGAQAPPGRYTPSINNSQPSTGATQPQRYPQPSNPFASQQSFSTPTDGVARPAGPPSGPPRGPPVGASINQSQTLSPEAQSDERTSSRIQKPPSPKHPPGDRSHIPSGARIIYELLDQDLQRVKAQAPVSFKNHVNDVEKRLNILFDHLNNETLLRPNTVEDMKGLAESIKAKDYEKAMSIHLELVTNRTEECGSWMIGVKRLISMSRATP